ncbi:hypothetical protein BUALT_Bualt19G0048400 [Buddleja alternifolia]|uniref:DUF4283 domain-containing protein n=1 Tax=Buddleja alternifolia TaxID=168488 RepID=A0AAV6W1E7_9LAMI|nr:hypothetical protein BUALT_Bualt19G0048400 [Buddleja alternifolia]
MAAVSHINHIPSSSSNPPSSSTREPPDKSPAKPAYLSIKAALYFGYPKMKKGLRDLFFSKQEMADMVAPLKFALVSKFSFGVPSISRVRACFSRFGLKGLYTVAIIDFNHVLINLSSDEDYTHIWLKKEWLIDGFLMKTFKMVQGFLPVCGISYGPGTLSKKYYMRISPNIVPFAIFWGTLKKNVQ